MYLDLSFGIEAYFSLLHTYLGEFILMNKYYNYFITIYVYRPSRLLLFRLINSYSSCIHLIQLATVGQCDTMIPSIHQFFILILVILLQKLHGRET